MNQRVQLLMKKAAILRSIQTSLSRADLSQDFHTTKGKENKPDHS